MEENLIAGLISGLIVTLLVVVFRAFWLSVIVPWFEERVYKDVHIEGRWYSLYPEMQSLRQEVITLKRQGHKITGSIVCTVSSGDKGEEYEINGSFRNLILPITYESTDRTKTDRGSITLKSVANAERLEGNVSLYNTYDDEIQSSKVIWYRSHDELEISLRKFQEKRKLIAALVEKRQKAQNELRDIEKEEPEEAHPTNNQS